MAFIWQKKFKFLKTYEQLFQVVQPKVEVQQPIRIPEYRPDYIPNYSPHRPFPYPYTQPEVSYRIIVIKFCSSLSTFFNIL